MSRQDKNKGRGRISALENKPTKRIKRLDYVEYHRSGEIEKVFCKVCGTLIKSLVPAEGYGETREINGRIIQVERLVLAEMPNYSEVEIEMDDGSRHVTCVCTSCLGNLDSVTLDEVYDADLRQWDKDERNNKGAVPWPLVVNRKPKQAKRIR